MLGNTDLYSTFKCDDCKSRFSLFETDLASFLGFGRSISGLRDNKKASGFPGIDLEAKSILFKGKKLMVIHKEDAMREIEEARPKLQYQKPAYTLSNVYKLFLKCGPSVLPQDKVILKYRSALKNLRGVSISR